MSLPGGGEREPRALKPRSLSLAHSGAEEQLKSYTPTQLFFLMRMSYMQRQKRDCINVLEQGDWRMRLLNKALYSTFQDCNTEGVGDEAKLLLAPPRELS